MALWVVPSCNQHGCPGLVYEGGFRMVVKIVKVKNQP